MNDRRNLIFCAVLVVTAVTATVPVLEMGTNDDWSYIWVARELAATGHLKFNGWIGAMIGVQAYWAALFIRLFGFSFTLVRLSTVPFAVGCAVVFYRLCRNAGLNPSFAMFGTLAVLLSPVFIAVSASFMTDVPGFFFWLCCAYCGVRAIEATTPHRAWMWLTAIAIAGVAGGTIRQIIWTAPLIVIALVALLRRRERQTLICAAALWLACICIIALCVKWYSAQPGVTPVTQIPEPLAEMVVDAAERIEQIAVGTLLLILPILILYVAAYRKWLRAPVACAVGVLVAAVAMGGLWWFDDDLLLGNMVTPYGMLWSLDLLGDKPEILTTPILLPLGALLFFTAAITAATVFIDRRMRASDSLRRFVLVYGPVCALYFLAITYRGVTTWLIFDRYFVVITPILIVPLLWHFQEHVRASVPMWGWVAAGVLAAFGIANTHDYLAAERTRLRAATAVTLSGIPRTHVSAGLEYDGWTQLEAAGMIYTPAEKETSTRAYPVSPPYWFWKRTPAVEPVYVLTYSKLPGVVDSGFPPLQFTAWLPPFRRTVFTEKWGGNH